MSLVGFGRNVFVKDAPVKKETKGQWIYPDTEMQDLVRGEVVVCNDEPYYTNGKNALKVSKGDIVIYPKLASIKVLLDNTYLVKLSIEDIVAIEKE